MNPGRHRGSLGPGRLPAGGSSGRVRRRGWSGGWGSGGRGPCRRSWPHLPALITEDKREVRQVSCRCTSTVQVCECTCVYKCVSRAYIFGMDGGDVPLPAETKHTPLVCVVTCLQVCVRTRVSAGVCSYPCVCRCVSVPVCLQVCERTCVSAGVCSYPCVCRCVFVPVCLQVCERTRVSAGV